LLCTILQKKSQLIIDTQHQIWSKIEVALYITKLIIYGKCQVLTSFFLIWSNIRYFFLHQRFYYFLIENLNFKFKF
jgi:hypothetical protein